MINYEINRLVYFACQHHLMLERDKEYAVNMLLDVLQLEDFEQCEVNEHVELPDEILKNILNDAIARGLIEDTITERDLFDTKIMNCVMAKPSTVEEVFWDNYKTSPEAATNYFYHFSIASNYIRKARVDKDQKWKGKSKYGDLDITINLSKPEKDPKEIARMKLVKSGSYPKCVICKENEGFKGNMKLAARQSIRLITLDMNQETWFLQYSPYVYYQEHCIILNSQHKPMQINKKTFVNLLSFLDKFPHYFIGSNADLPIVGGSILSHDHYQGGHYTFAMNRAKIRKQYSIDAFPNVALSLLHWPLTTIRLSSQDATQVIECADHILEVWKNYTDENAQIYAFSGKERHNTITPIARKSKDCYQLDLVLRNNRTSAEFPLGIFHPHPDVHHIKKENIGLIEVMGLAVLPARLKQELQSIQKYLCKETISEEEQTGIEKHQDWIASFQEQTENMNASQIMDLLKKEVSHKFERVLEDCAVFGLDEAGMLAFEKFMHTVL